LLGVALAATLGPAAAVSQESAFRPEVPDGADPNDAQSYYDAGVQSLRREPTRAAGYFRWAALLDPEWAEPLEGWRAAVLMGQIRGLSEYMARSRQNQAFRLVDSLRFQASIRNPLQFRPFEGEIVQAAVRSTARALDPTEVLNRAELEYELERAFRGGDLTLRAMLAYSNHELPYALELYQQAIERADSLSRGGLLLDRAHALSVAGRYEDARVEYDAALQALRKVDDEELIIFYQSKALPLYSKGLIAELAGDHEQARADFSGAIEEDLSFHPAHMGLARVSLAEGDTANALFGYRMAADLAPDDPRIRMKLAGLMVATGDPTGAEGETRAAIAANPAYAAPHLVMGALAERGGRVEEAITHYRRYLELSPRSGRNRAPIESRVAALEAANAAARP